MKMPLTIALLLTLVSIQTTHAQQTTTAAPDQASRRVMEHWVGEWSGGVAGAADVATPHIAATPDHAKVEWTLDNRFLRGTNFARGDKQVGIWLMRYSPKTQKYKVWFFTSQGDATVWDGTWDNAKQTMNWKTTNPETGATGSGHTRFVDNRQEWKMSITQDGKTAESSGSLRRK
jgi:hypothetical protein